MKKLLIIIVLPLLLNILGVPLTMAGVTTEKDNFVPTGYIVVNDSTDCPVKILAYRIDYLESGETTMRMWIKNTSELQVVGIQGTFELIDKDGMATNSIQEDPTFTFKDRTLLPAHSQPCAGASFVIEEGHRVKTVKPQITQVLFEDQSIWREF